MDRQIVARAPGLPGSLLALVIFLSLLLVSSGQAAIHPGNWTPDVRWGAIGDTVSHAVHLILLPGDGVDYHSRILWWRGEQSFQGGPVKFYGDQWGWKKPTENYDCSAYPTNLFEDISGSSPPPLTEMDPFCAGHALLDSSYVLVAGGTDPNTANFGENKARIFRPGTGTSFGTWSTAPEPMDDWRWYPTTIPLKNAQALTLSGQGYPHHRVFGGFQNGSLPGVPTGDQVYRLVPVTGGSWDSPIVPADDGTADPEIRRAHTFVETFRESQVSPADIPGFEQAQTLFGGRDVSGNALNDTWKLIRDNNYAQADYTYRWKRVLAASEPARSDHSAVVGLNSMIIFGGRNNDGSPRGDTRRLHEDGGVLQWDGVTTTGAAGDIPSNRFGHRAVYDIGGSRKMIVFGGHSGDGADPVDLNVYELQLTTDGSQGTWKKMSVIDLGSPKPAPRFDHTMTFDPNVYLHTHPGTTKQGRVAFVFGGQLADSPPGTDVYSDSLWALWIFTDDTVGWELRSYGGPSARARHTMTFDVHQPKEWGGRLYLMGGEGNGTITGNVYTFDPWAANPSWVQWASPGATFSGHTMIREYAGTSPRIAERFTPPNSWDMLPGAHVLQRTYPPTFLIPGASGDASRVLTIDLSPGSRIMDVPPSGTGGSWASYQSFTNFARFEPLTGVVYRPGKIMVAGGTEDNPSYPSGPRRIVTGRTLTIDATSGAGSWVEAPSSMEARFYHNLVLLPNGKVLAVGGKVSTDTNPVGTPVKQPQIWDPATGYWTSLTTDPLDVQGMRRGYHSTAILLPDGRVLSAGGEFADQFTSDKYHAEIYCPPYLFTGTSGLTLATRPSITSVPDTVTYGRRFVVCTPEAQTISSACLIRPGATTHAFDMNQRFVPLTIDSRCGNQLTVTMPATQNEAPPGFYMLFVLLGETPSIAKWVRLIRDKGLDDCDATPSSSITDLTVATGYTNAIISWTDRGDDGTCGLADSLDLRYHPATILNESNFGAGYSISTSLPGPSGTYHCIEKTGLESCRQHSFAIKTWDGKQWASISNVVNVSTKCTSQTVYCEEGLMGGGGGGGGSESAQAPPMLDQMSIGRAEAVTSPVHVENSLLWGPNGAEVTDYLSLGQQTAESGGYRIRLRETGVRAAVLDHLRLGAVDHASEASVVAGVNKAFVGAIKAAASVKDESGAEVSGLRDGSLSNSYDVKGGQILIVDLGQVSPTTAVVVESDAAPIGSNADSIGILVQKPANEGAWTTISTIYPRRFADRIAVGAEGNSTLRLVSLRSYGIRSVSRMDVSALAVPQEFVLASAEHSRLGSAVEDVRLSGGTSTKLEPGDTLELAYTATPVPPGMVRDVFLIAKGQYEAAAATTQLAQSGDLEQALQAQPVFEFALGQARPNPSRGSVSIIYSLAQESPVSIRVYDVAGRLVRTLVNETGAPGPHEATWDATNDDGRRVAAGVYFYRMNAGAWQSQRKVVFLER